jgi:hypothetical protein
MDKQREEFEKRTSKRLGYKFPEAYKIPAVYNDWCNWQECWQAAQAAMQPEIDRMKEQVHQYDKWLSGGIYWTNEEYDEQVRKPLADCQAKLNAAMQTEIKTAWTRGVLVGQEESKLKITELEAQLATQKKQWFDDIADRNGTIGKLQEQLSELKCDHWRLREIADEDL